MSHLPPGSDPADLVRLASDLLEAETAEPVFISLDGRTVAPSLVRRAVRSLLDARLAAAACAPGAQDDVALAPVEVELSDVTEHILAWGSVVLSEVQAAALVDALASEGRVRVARRAPRSLWLLPAPAPPAPDGPP